MTKPPGGIGSLIRESALYGMASLAGTLATLLLAPVYLHVLDPAEYGKAALVTTAGTFLFITSILALDTASHRMLWESEEDEHRRRVFGTWLWTSLAASVAAYVVVLVLWGAFAASGRSSDILELTVIWSFSLPFRIVQHVRLQWARAHRRPLSAAAWALALALLTTMFGLLFVPVLDLGAAGIVLSQTVAAVLVGGVAAAAPTTRRLLVMGVDRALLRRMIKFSLPLLPTGLAIWFLAFGDRWILEIFYGEESVGLYQAAFTVAGLIALPLAAFNQAFPPWAFSIHKDPDGRQQLRRAFVVVMAASAAAAFVVSLAAGLLIRILAQDEFEPARTMVPYLVFSLVAQAAFSFTAIGCNVAERNGPIAVAMLVGALVILPVVLVSDRWLDADSVALSTLVSQLVTAALVTWSSERLWRVGYGWRAPAFAACACIAAIAIAG